MNTCTQYYYTVFAANCTGSPQYITNDPLIGNTGSYYCNCSDAVNVPPSIAGTTPSFLINDTVNWYKFTASSQYFKIGVIDTSNDIFSKFYIYTGNCGGLILIDSSINSSNKILTINDLTVDNIYYIKIIKPYLSSPLNVYYSTNTDVLNCWEPTCHDNENPNNLTPGYSFSCDLICNGSFEYYTSIPSQLSQIGLACPWGSINDGTPDYYNSDDISSTGCDVSVPNNIFGYQYDFISNHKGYAGICMRPSVNNYEYIFQQLKKPLIPGFTYNITFKASKGEYSTAIDNLGVYLSSTNPYYGSDPAGYDNKSVNSVETSNVIVSPFTNYIPDQTWIWRDYNPEPYNFITETTNWETISYNFKPTEEMGNLWYITIGPFGQTNFQTTPPDYVITSCGYLAPIYYYIDEVHITPIATITGLSSICKNSTTTYHTDNVPGTSYCYWTITGGIINSGNGTNTVSVTWKTSGTQTITVNTYCNEGCEISTNYSVEVLESPPIPEITGPNNNCDPNSTYTVSNYTNFTWIVTKMIDGVPYSSTGTGNPTSIAWPTTIDNNYPCKVEVTIEGSNSCNSTSSIDIYNCCAGTIESDNFNGKTFDVNSQIPTDPVLYFNSTIIINYAATLSSQTIKMGPHAHIIVNSGNSLEIYNTTIEQGCGVMWEDIQVNSVNSEVDVTGGSTIRDAINGLVSEYGGTFVTDNANFIDNYYNIKVKGDYVTLLPGNPYPIHPGIIRNTTFIGNNALQYPPYYAIKTLSGVDCDNVHYFTIGDYSLSSYKNTFRNMQYGIYASNSDILVYNNEFDNIAYQPQQIAPHNNIDFYFEGAIYAIHEMNSHGILPNYLTVGDLGLKKNSFNNCNTGIFSFDYYNTLNDNEFNYGKMGINLLNANNSTVDRNSIGESTANTFNPYTGISIQNAYSLNPISSSVDSNIIYNQKIGIYLINASAKNNHVRYNEITYNQQYFPGNNGYVPSKYTGIEIHNCENLFVFSNSINRNKPLTGEESSDILGIKIDNCKKSTLNYNTMTQMGSGIYTSGNLLNTQFECNNFHENYYGIQFEAGSTLSNQGVYGTPNGYNPANVWYDYYSTYRAYVNGSGILGSTQFQYYFWNTDYTPIPNNLALYISVDPNSINVNYCTNTTPINPNGDITTATMREAEIGAIVRNQLVFDTLQAENTAMEREYAYKLLLSDSGLIYMGDTSDYVYLAFYNSMQSSDAAHTLNARVAMDSNNIVVAQRELSLIADTNAVNHNRIIVDNIYLNTWAQDNYHLTDDQVKILTDIAYSDPYTNGDAVYTARVMLNINPDGINPKSAIFIQKPNKEVKPNTVHVYPNPARETITVTFDQPLANEGTVEIWSIIGNKLQSNTIPKAYAEQKVNVSSLSSGIYFYIIKVNGDKFSSGKITIIK